MHVKPARRSSLFLMELLIAILFFSLSAAVCVRIFVKSYTLELESADLNYAVNASTSVAEILRHHETPVEYLKTTYPLADFNKNSICIYYDTDWQPSTMENCTYMLELTLNESTTCVIGQIDVFKADQVLYTLTIEKHRGMEVHS